MLPLSKMSEGSTGTVARIAGGHGICERLASMGVRSGVELSVLRNAGPVIVRVKDNRLVIGRGMVDRILINPASLTD